MYLWYRFILILCLLLAGCGAENITLPPENSDVIRVEKGTFVSGVEDVGIIQATKSASVITEGDGKIARMAPEGKHVEKGEPVLWLDDQDIRKQIETEKINLKRHKSDLERAEESLSESRFNLEQTLKEQRASHEFDKLNVQRTERELALLKDRYQRQLIPESEVLATEAELERKRLRETSSGLSLEKALVQYDSKMKSLQTDLAIARQKFERSQFRMEELKSNLDKMVSRASAAGIVVIHENWRKEQFKVGDRVWPGVKVLEIPDLSEFQVWSQVPEVNLQRVAEKQTVSIRVHALDNLSLSGSVNSISWLAMPRVLSRGTGYTSDDSTEGGQVFEIQINLNESDPRLKPGMNVSVVYVEEQIPDVLIVPISAVAENEDGHYVFEYTGRQFKPVDVDVGSRNRSEAVILDGLREGQRIALFNPGRRL